MSGAGSCSLACSQLASQLASTAYSWLLHPSILSGAIISSSFYGLAVSPAFLITAQSPSRTLGV